MVTVSVGWEDEVVFRLPSLLTLQWTVDEKNFTPGASGLCPVKGVRLSKPSAWGEFVSQVRALYLAFFLVFHVALYLTVYLAFFVAVLSGIYSGILSGIPSIWRLRSSGAP